MDSESIAKCVVKGTVTLLDVKSQTSFFHSELLELPIYTNLLIHFDIFSLYLSLIYPKLSLNTKAYLEKNNNFLSSATGTIQGAQKTLG